jgi:pyruvate/oxaloacetate carboxyltransferase
MGVFFKPLDGGPHFADQPVEQLRMGAHVAVEIHAHEAGELQEARIDVALEAGVRERHLDDDVAGEPLIGRLIK